MHAADAPSDGRTLLVSGLLFFGIFLSLYLLYLAAEPLLVHYFNWLARSVAGAVAWFDPQVSARDNLIFYGPRATVRVIEGCDGVTVFILIVAAVLAFPKPWPQRWAGVLLLVPVLFIINWLRLLVLTLISFYLPDQFHWVHVYLFQPVMILATFVCFIVWIVRAGDGRGPAVPV